MKNLVIALVGFIFVVAVLFIFFSLKKSTVKTTPVTPPSKNVADINRDGIVDSVDKNYVLTSMGCSKTASCWSKVVGKTSDGDNPIYASDLDLNHDGLIDQSDLNMIK